MVLPAISLKNSSSVNSSNFAISSGVSVGAGVSCGASVGACVSPGICVGCAASVGFAVGVGFSAGRVLFPQPERQRWETPAFEVSDHSGLSDPGDTGKYTAIATRSRARVLSVIEYTIAAISIDALPAISGAQKSLATPGR